MRNYIPFLEPIQKELKTLPVALNASKDILAKAKLLPIAQTFVGIIAKGIPKIAEEEVILDHFKLFGTIKSFVRSPSGEMCIVKYENNANAQRVF